VTPEILVDTGAWVALIDKRDGLHGTAASFYHKMLTDYARVVTTNLVLAETFALIRRRCGLRDALKLFTIVESSNRALKICSDDDLERQAVNWLARYADQDFTLVDSVSFALMQSSFIITDAFAFDAHFQVAGFTRRPDPSKISPRQP